jgi:serine phosphatase RsbU (regulator of sigma subunit)
MHVGSLGSRKFTTEDADLLQLAADRAALAVQSLLSQADRAAATALARSLVPSALPPFAGLQMAARYVPGSGDVGGDWYDVFTLPSGELCVVVGDVAGTGLRAAVIMGRMRSALRAYALETSDPADVLARLDRKMQHFEPQALATVLYAVFDRSLDRVLISSAGHLPPVILTPGRAPELAHIHPDLMIGVSGNVCRRVTTVATPPGTVVCFYTDGLVERRDQPLDDRLSQLCASLLPGPPGSACASLMNSMAGSEPPADDIALLIVQRQPSP